MSEKSQVVHMIIRVCRLAAERWGMTLAQVVEVMTPADALGYILRKLRSFPHGGGRDGARRLRGIPRPQRGASRCRVSTVGSDEAEESCIVRLLSQRLDD